MKPVVEKALLIYKRANKRTHVINYSEYLRKIESISKLWRLATEDEIIEFQRKRGRNIEIKAPEIKVKSVSKPKEIVKEPVKEKIILRSDPIQEIPKEKEIKKEFDINKND